MAVVKVKNNIGEWTSIPFGSGGDNLPKDGIAGQVLKKTDTAIAWDNANNHTHSASSIIDGALSVEIGGTGATTAEAARANLGTTQAQIITWGADE